MHSPTLVVYGLGNTGMYIVDKLIEAGHKVTFIVDQGKHGSKFSGIPVISMDQLKSQDIETKTCLIGLYNHYIDINKIYDELINIGFEKIYTVINIKDLLPDFELPTEGLWLDYNYSYASDVISQEEFYDLLSDSKSVEIAKSIIHYRTTGDISKCPLPSLHDEYVPSDLPSYKGPLRLIDCGAYTGVAIDKFLRAHYQIQSLVAFEPDGFNFDKLVEKNYSVDESYFLPLGVWSENKKFKFKSKGTMGSAIGDDGDEIVQCVKIDSVLRGFKPNLIKMDVEGAEYDALLGAEDTIRQFRPNLCISVYHRPIDIFSIALLINSWELNYKFYLRVHEYNTFGLVLYCLQDDIIVQKKTNNS